MAATPTERLGRWTAAFLAAHPRSRLTGVTGHGDPIGTVTLAATSTPVTASCKSVTAGADTIVFTCHLASGSALGGGSHSLTATYLPGVPDSSSDNTYSYAMATSAALPVAVVVVVAVPAPPTLTAATPGNAVVTLTWLAP